MPDVDRSILPPPTFELAIMSFGLFGNILALAVSYGLVCLIYKFLEHTLRYNEYYIRQYSPC
jgi:hypothetical protein